MDDAQYIGAASRGKNVMVVIGILLVTDSDPFNTESGEQQFIYLFSILNLFEINFRLKKMDEK